MKANAFIEACRADVRILDGAVAWLQEEYEKAGRQMVDADGAEIHRCQGGARRIRELMKMLPQLSK